MERLQEKGMLQSFRLSVYESFPKERGVSMMDVTPDDYLFREGFPLFIKIP